MQPQSNKETQNKVNSDRLKRTEAYAEKVRLMFAQTVNDIMALNKRIPNIAEGQMYSFDGDTQKVQNEVERLLRRLQSVCVAAIKSGISLEWAQANSECDKLVSSAFGKKALDGSGKYAGYTNRNDAAMKAFVNRTDKGFDLSSRVWQSVKQLKDEMEVALTVSMGEGASSQEISRNVRKYLNDPDLMFRRFRYKAGEKDIIDPSTGEVTGKEIVWGKKWKKRVLDDNTGKYRWIDYNKNNYPSGQGVYKSSAKNAMRLARTETNMAYRNADFERWQQMDFVLGVRIEPTSHTKKERKKDICDKLAGDYPKDFRFEGWHPQCFCIATPILVSDEEMIAKAEAEDRGEAYQFKAKPIKKCPEGFNQWVVKNGEKIKLSRSMGNEPYFLAHNRAAIDNILNPKASLTPQELAEIRHSERTPEKEKMLKEYWDKKVAAGNELRARKVVLNNRANNILSIAENNGYSEFGIDVTDLKSAIGGGDIAAIAAQTKSLIAKMQSIKRPIIVDAKSTIKTGADYGEFDASELNASISSGKLLAIKKSTETALAAIKAIKAQEDALSDLIPNAHGWHKQFTMAELQGVYTAVKSKISSFPSRLDEKKEKLEFEIGWVEDHKKYKTWAVARDAYKRELTIVKREIQLKSLADDAAKYLKLASLSKSDDLIKLSSGLRTLLSKPDVDLTLASKKVEELKILFNQSKAEEVETIIGKPQKVIRETLDELKARLGDKLPKTLTNLDKTIDKYDAIWRGKNEVKYADEIRQVMQEVFDAHDFGMNIKLDALDKVLSTHFKNTFEVGRSGGYCGSHSTSGPIERTHARLMAAHKLFGINRDKDLLSGQLQRNEYEKYGNLLDHNIAESLKKNTATWYGAIEVRFKKDKVIATWTAADSLGGTYQPTLVSDPRSSSFDSREAVPLKGAVINDLNDFKKKYINTYLELQYHGDLTPDCVESISFPYDLLSYMYSNDYKIALKWKAKGVKIFYINDEGNLKSL